MNSEKLNTLCETIRALSFELGVSLVVKIQSPITTYKRPMGEHEKKLREMMSLILGRKIRAPRITPEMKKAFKLVGNREMQCEKLAKLIVEETAIHTSIGWRIAEGKEI